ncbi:MAG: hypothetical protein JW929_04345 [Anaerolineales bacterium]|nr:hypothetical protein [Anaerolineales bacterium]
MGDKDGNEVYEGVRNDVANPVDFGKGDAFGVEAELHELLNTDRITTTRKERKP